MFNTVTLFYENRAYTMFKKEPYNKKSQSKQLCRRTNCTRNRVVITFTFCIVSVIHAAHIPGCFGCEKIAKAVQTAVHVGNAKSNVQEVVRDLFIVTAFVVIYVFVLVLHNVFNKVTQVDGEKAYDENK